MQLARFENALGEVHAVRILLNAQEQFPRGSRTVDEWSPEGLKALEMVTVNMAEEARERCGAVWVFAKVVDCGWLADGSELERGRGVLWMQGNSWIMPSKVDMWR